jgi:hypothetical protein
MMKFHGMVAFLGGGNRFVMVFTLGEGGTATGKRESQREENDSNCSEFHFSPFLKYIFLECLRAHHPFIIQSRTDTHPQEGRQ